MIVEQMKRVPGVVAVGRTDIGIDTDNNNNTGIIPPGSNKQVDIGNYNVDEGFFDAMGLTLKAGRWFDPNRPMDDMTMPYPDRPGRREGARRARRQRRDQRICGAASSASNRRRRRSARPCSGELFVARTAG